jgi:glycerophosphoryl diester phosphodiesterase
MASGFLPTALPFGFAHQGGTDVAPGNTVAAFDHAVSLGYRYIETDVHRTSDGVLVVFHDDDLEPSTGVAGPVEAKTWNEVAQLRVRGEHPIPRLDDVLDRYPGVRFNIEPKQDSAVDALIDTITSRGLLDRVCIGSFSDRRVRRFKAALGPSLCTSPGPWGLARILVTALVWPRAGSSHAAVQIPTRYRILPLATRFWIKRLHRMGLQVHVWTINTEPEMGSLLDRGADALMSDTAGLLRQVLASRGAWPETGPGRERSDG